MTTKLSSTTTLAMRHILVPIDFSSASQRAATLAFALARQVGAQVRCMNVLELPAALRATLGDVPTAANLERGTRSDWSVPWSAKSATRQASVKPFPLYGV